jgi:hypothetical protein
MMRIAMLRSIEEIFNRIKAQEQQHIAAYIALRRSLLDANVNIQIHNQIGEDVTRLMYEISPDYARPTSYDTIPMEIETIKRRKKRNGSIKTTNRKRPIDRSRSG